MSSSCHGGGVSANPVGVWGVVGPKDVIEERVELYEVYDICEKRVEEDEEAYRGCLCRSDHSNGEEAEREVQDRSGVAGGDLVGVTGSYRVQHPHRSELRRGLVTNLVYLRQGRTSSRRVSGVPKW